MKINWKEVAKSEGYKALKDAYKKDAQQAGMSERPMRDKAEFRRFFVKIIGRATSHAIRTGRPIEDILLDWSTVGQKYSNWWLNHYNDRQMAKLPSGKPRNVEHEKSERYLKRWRGSKSNAEYFKSLKEQRTREAKLARKNLGKKARWTPDQKRNAASARKWRESNL